MSSKIIVTGPGHCGTTYFMKLLSELGFDTGFDAAGPSAQRLANDKNPWHGFEWPIRGKHAVKENMPRIIKSPKICMDLMGRAAVWDWNIEHVYILLRDYKDIANHRWTYKHPTKTGGIRDLAEAEHKQANETKAAMWVGNIVYTVVSENIPYTFLMFPRIVTDPYYLWSTCGLFKTMLYTQFKAGFDKVADIQDVHWGREETNGTRP